MNSAFNNLVIYNGYPLSLTLAIGFHIIILAFLIWLQSSSSIDNLEIVQPAVIKALFIDENPQVKNRRIVERQRVEQIEREEIQQENERQRQAQQELERQTELERRNREEERERAALREREELEEQSRREQLRVREENEREERRQRELLDEEQRRAELESERARQQEAEAEGARTELELIQSATAIIQLAVQQVWNRPPSARNGMRAILQIRMLPTGELLDARITESSGDPAFDRSAENAVYGAAPFTELRNLPINTFNSNFRTLSLIFQPEDLLN